MLTMQLQSGVFWSLIGSGINELFNFPSLYVHVESVEQPNTQDPQDPFAIGTFTLVFLIYNAAIL